MKTRIFALMFLLGSSVLAQDGYVPGHVRTTGYRPANVTPHVRPSPHGYSYSNYSTTPNITPFTGVVGTRTVPSSYGPRPSYYTPSFNAPPRGGITIRYGR